MSQKDMSYIYVFVRELLILFAGNHTYFRSFWMTQLCEWAIAFLLFWISDLFMNDWLVPSSRFWEALICEQMSHEAYVTRFLGARNERANS